MRPVVGLARILIAMLVLRVVASPIAARPSPSPPRPPSYGQFVVRVCAWPVLRPMRVVSPTILTQRPRWPGYGTAGRLIPPAEFRALGALKTGSALSAQAPRGSTSSPPVYLSDCPRC